MDQLVYLYFCMYQDDRYFYDSDRLMNITQTGSSSSLEETASRIAALDVLLERLDIDFPSDIHDYISMCEAIACRADRDGLYLLARSAEFSAEDARELLRDIERPSASTRSASTAARRAIRTFDERHLPQKGKAMKYRSKRIANLTGADLAGADLAGANLVDANLSGAYLVDATLSGANLSSANLSSANLICADMTDANLAGATLSGAYLVGATLAGADLAGANLSGVYLVGATLSGANLSGADLVDANLSGADLVGADLSGADLSGANLSSATLAGANLSGADLAGATLARATLARANLSSATLTGADLIRADMTGANLTGTCLDPNAPVPVTDLSELGTVDSDGFIVCYRTRESLFAGSTVYEVGKTYVAPVFSVDTSLDCNPGIYVASLDWLRQNYPHETLVQVRVRASDTLRTTKGKFRTKRIEVLEVVGN